MEPIYFDSATAFRKWLQRHHRSASEVLVGFHKRHTERPTLTWPESVDEALCFGWIDGVRRSVDAERYTIRFTPRKPRSIWSKVNVRKAEALIANGRMHAAGHAAFAARDNRRSGVYSFEQESPAQLTADAEAAFEAKKKAWTFFASQPPGYRRTAIWWVISAKRAETRARRLKILIDDSEAGQRIALLRR